MAKSSCLVLVPVGLPIEPACEEGLRELERRGYEVRRVRGYAAIDQGRCQMATDALAAGAEETMWIDTDIGFSADDVERLRSHNRPIVSAVYPQKGRRSLASHLLPGTKEVLFGTPPQGVPPLAGSPPHSPLLEIMYAATGFLLVRREVYETIQRKLTLPVCNRQFGRPLIPFFQPMIKQTDRGPWYLAEDFSFSERARQAGYQIWADTSIRLRHYGSYGYSWEDAGAAPKRYAAYRYHLLDGSSSPPTPGEGS